MSNWFYIQSKSTNKVISALPNATTYLRSQVIVTNPALTDNELWCWQDQFLVNKSTNFVLDIRKGRLRLIEDTEICLYSKKPIQEAHNQLWAVHPSSHAIYSLCNQDWVLDTQPLNKDMDKLVLQPSIDNQPSWSFVPEGQLTVLQITASNPSPFVQQQPQPEDYPKGLTPAKRGSHPTVFSMETFKEYHQRVYISQEPNISDKGIAMATAYHIFQNWKLDQQSNDLMFSSSNETRQRLQNLTQDENSKILANQLLYSNNNKDHISTISNRLISQLYDQTPISP